MALSADALTTLAAVKAYLGLAAATDDALIEGIIEAVGAEMNAFTGRRLTARDYSHDPLDAAYDPANALLSGSGYAELLLPQYPVQAVTSLMVDDRAVPKAASSLALGWILDSAAGVISLNGEVFPRGRNNVGLAYRAGFETVPFDLAQAAVEQAVWRYKETAAGGGRLGIRSRSLADGSVAYHGGELLPQVRAVLERYRNRSLL